VATYRLFSNCDFCKDGHPFPFAVSLQIESTKKMSIGDIFFGKKLPNDIESIISNQIHCSNSGNLFVQDDVTKIYLIPTG
jgi:hypothetical protein